MKKLGTLLLGLAMAMLLTSSARAQGGGPLADLMQQTGLKYLALDDQSWDVPFDDGSGGTLHVFVTYSNEERDFALIFATVVDREDHHAFSREVLVEAMKLNNDYPGVKFVLDDAHGDIDCQTEVYMATITPESLKMYIERVAGMTTDNAARLGGL